jgi:glucokinase
LRQPELENDVTEVVALDIGGTHARFTVAQVEPGQCVSLGETVTLKTAEHASLQTAWEEYARQAGRPLPRAAAIAVAGPVQGEVLKLTNNPWVIRPAFIQESLNVDDFILVNDFGAVAHAVGQLEPDKFTHICGPDLPLPAEGVVSIVGPGTGLGVAQLLRRDGGYHVIETEGGHIDFAPLDSIEDEILRHLRKRFRRVSVERVASGQGLSNIYEILARIEGLTTHYHDEKMLWTAALSGSDSLANAALDRFCLALGSVAGDIALAQGAQAVVIAGGIGARVKDHLRRSGFRDRFIAKGRFERVMDSLPVKLITHEQPGLFGAAAAYSQRIGLSPNL